MITEQKNIKCLLLLEKLSHLKTAGLSWMITEPEITAGGPRFSSQNPVFPTKC